MELALGIKLTFCDADEANELGGTGHVNRGRRHVKETRERVEIAPETLERPYKVYVWTLISPTTAGSAR